VKYYCFKCKDEVRLPAGTEDKAAEIEIVCEDCVGDMRGKWAGNHMFMPETDDAD
jgi:hypothetical protein